MGLPIPSLITGKAGGGVQPTACGSLVFASARWICYWFPSSATGDTRGDIFIETDEMEI